jgi:A/G-specific adenine glycosylase
MTKTTKAFFTNSLLKWHRARNRREMPWKGEKDPYRVWLSEIILQQTRVEQGLAYYQKFVREFPRIQDLAEASDKKVFKLWEGLGYYSRCRSLIHTARFITEHYHGKFPHDFETISGLKGIGPYTASAISSFAFNLPYAVLDGNVNRVISRVFGISTGIDTSAGKKIFSTLAQELLNQQDPGEYNQAIMDLGATICKPKSPRCPECPFHHYCEARLHNQIDKLPVKEKKPAKKQRYINYIIAHYRGSFYVRERKGKDIWLNLHEFIPMETSESLDGDKRKLQSRLCKLLGTDAFSIELVSDVQNQQLTHQHISGRFVHIKLSKSLERMDGFARLSGADLDKIAFPKFILNYLRLTTKFSARKPNSISKR